jgi:hypothetical protein
MRKILNPLTTEGKHSKQINTHRTKSFGYQVLGFGGGGVAVTAEFDYLVVAGGGGSTGSIAGGGGAGGYRTSYPGGSKIEISAGDTITIGAGGAPTPTSPSASGRIAGKGGDSVAGLITSAAGGTPNGDTGYGPPNTSADNQALRDGGSGAGGGHQYSYPVGAGNVPPTSPPQGNPAGPGNGTWGASGGGGASGAGASSGSNAYSSPGGAGGAGTSSSITGASVCRAGGGGGGAFVAGGSGGPASCGGGAGGSDPGGVGIVGTVNTGGGAGGGCGSAAAPGQYKNGGSGIVILRLATSDAPAGIGVTPGTNTVTTDGSDTVLTFTVSGTVTL